MALGQVTCLIRYTHVFRFPVFLKNLAEIVLPDVEMSIPLLNVLPLLM